MAISSTDNKVRFVQQAGGTLTQWEFGFRTLNEADIVVYVGDYKKVQGTDYSVSLYSDQTESPGGVVTIDPAVAEGTAVTILRQVALTQETDLLNGGAFNAEVIEAMVDKNMMALQQHDEEVARCLKIPPTSNQDVDTLVEDTLEAAKQAKASEEAAAGSAAEAQAALDQTEVVGDQKVAECTAQAEAAALSAGEAESRVEQAVQSSGLANPNLLINGGFDVWQAGTSITTNNNLMFIADCWVFGKSGVIVSCQQGLMTNTNLVSLLGAAPASNITFTCEQGTSLQNRIEEYTRLRGKEVTFSFISDTPSGISVEFGFYNQGDGTYTSTEPRATTVLGTKDGWYLHSVTDTFPSYDLAADIRFAHVTTFLPAATSKQLTGCKLELGAIRTPFESEKYGTVLAQCQRYYQKHPMLYLYTVTGSLLARRYTAPRLVPMRTDPAESFTPSSGETISVGQQSSAGLISLEASATSTGASVVAWTYIADARL